MEFDLFIKKQVEMLNDDFSKQRVKENVFRLVFAEYINVYTLEAIIFLCMDIYAKIIIKHNKIKVQ